MSYPILKPNSTWFTPTVSTIKRSEITKIDITVGPYFPTESITDSWDASIAQDGSIMCYVEGTVLTIAGNGSGKIAANEDSSWMFSDIDKTDYFTMLTELNNLSTIDFSTATNFKAIFRNCLIVNLDVSGIDTSNVTIFDSAFRQCSKLVTLDLSSWDVSKCESLYAMFYKCSALTEVNVTGWNTPNLTTVDYLFDQCTNLQRFDATAFNAAKLTTMYCMFQNCSQLTELDVSGWNTSNAINMSFVFWGCKGLTRLAVENWNVSNVENFDHLFAHCNNLVVDVTNWRTSNKCKYYTAMFHTNDNEYLDVSGFDTSGAISMALMFEANTNLKKIKGLENFDTSNVASFQEMFFNCWNIEELDLSNFDTRKADTVTPIRSDGKYPSDCTNCMLDGCRSLKKITLGENFTFAGDGTATGKQIGALPVQNDTFIDGADGNWYTLDGTAYAANEVPNLTAATYYASTSIAKYERQKNKLIDLNGLDAYHAENVKYINEAVNAPKTELILSSSIEGSTKQFKLTIGDDGVLTISEIVESET